MFPLTYALKNFEIVLTFSIHQYHREIINENLDGTEELKIKENCDDKNRGFPRLSITKRKKKKVCVSILA
jgi:hypothetical protein